METLEKKKPFRRRFLKLTIEERLASLETEMRELKRLIIIRDYFAPIKNKQNSYIVEMRRQMAVRLFALGYTNSEVARTFSRNHASIINLMKSPSDPRIAEEVADNMDYWMDNELYPETYEVWVPSSSHKWGAKSEVRFKLKSLWDKE